MGSSKVDYFFVLLCLSSYCSYLVLGADETDLTRLRFGLLNGYQVNARPIQNHNDATVVGVHIVMKGFEFDEQRSVFTMHAWTVMVSPSYVDYNCAFTTENWRDDHLKWEKSNYGNISKINFGAHELWKPDLSVYNNFDRSEIDHFGNTRILAFNKGYVFWVPPTKFQVGCISDLRRWPYDTQTCTIILGSWSHDGSAINIFLPPNATKVGTLDLLPNREWRLISNSIVKRVRYYECCPGVPFPDLKIVLEIARESATHTAAVVIPALAIASAILIAFWIQPGATERLMVITIVIIINALYLNNIYVAIPNNGDSIPLVILFYRDSLIMVAAALLWTICLRYLAATKRSSPVPLPNLLTSCLDSWPAKMLCLDPRPVEKGSPGADSNADDEGKLVEPKNPYQEDWAWLAHLLDRVAFVVYFIVYFCFAVALL